MSYSLSQIIIHADLDAVRQSLIPIEDVSYIDEYGYTPLIEAIIVDDINKVLLLLEAGADVNQPDMTGRSPLHWAVFNNNFTILQHLLKAGADANAYSIVSEPVLTRPLLRGQNQFKDALVEHGASLPFVYDYINAKLLGHRFELVGSVDIVDPNGVFAEVDFEGFYLEFCLALIAHSLQTFRHQYVSRTLSPWFKDVDKIIAALSQAQVWPKYDHYLLNASSHFTEIQGWLKQDPLVIPISQEGHAFTLVKCGELFAICDRSERLTTEDSIAIYYMNRPSRLSVDLIVDVVYQKCEIEAIVSHLKQTLGLFEITKIPLRSQITGNCSWSNVEAIIPVLFYMLHAVDEGRKKRSKDSLVTDSLELFFRWRDWDTGRSLQFCMQNYESASPARKASITALLAAVMVQRLSADIEDHVVWAKQIIPFLKQRDYAYVLESYMATYVNAAPTEVGRNLVKLLSIYEREEDLG